MFSPPVTPFKPAENSTTMWRCWTQPRGADDIRSLFRGLRVNECCAACPEPSLFKACRLSRRSRTAITKGVNHRKKGLSKATVAGMSVFCRLEIRSRGRRKCGGDVGFHQRFGCPPGRLRAPQLVAVRVGHLFRGFHASSLAPPGRVRRGSARPAQGVYEVMRRVEPILKTV